ncbi:MAG TPA: septation protein IspZ [Stellaceae bacterium]|jgi:intracellular septation protein A|nr:septation protein IspZ [Stellaceae bacterium]
MARLRRFFGFLFRDFGPLIAFWAFYLTVGLRAAIAATIAYVLGDVLYRLRYGRRFTRVYLLSSGLAVVFGAIDLLAATPFMLKYEAVITNIATGIFFIAGARGSKPLIQEFAEQRSGPLPERLDVRRYFQLFTYAWAAYFLVKAGVYFALGQAYPLATALALRSIIGGISLGAMIVGSAALGRRGFFLLQRLDWLPKVEPEPLAEATASDPR